MSVAGLPFNNSLWLHCVSIGSEYLWLAVGEIPWLQVNAVRLDMGGRRGRWMVNCEDDGWSENGKEWNGTGGENGWLG